MGHTTGLEIRGPGGYLEWVLCCLESLVLGLDPFGGFLWTMVLALVSGTVGDVVSRMVGDVISVNNS